MFACQTIRACPIVLRRVKFHPPSTPVLSWLLDQNSGTFVVDDRTHAVGVTASRQQLYDDGEEHALPLTRRNVTVICGLDPAHLSVWAVVQQ
jgi:hypothetical protein